MPRTRKRPSSASEATVDRAVAAFRAAEPNSPVAAQIFLDRIGLVDLHDAAAVVAFSNPAARALRALLPGQPVLASTALERIATCIPSEPPVGPAAIAHLFFTQIAARAIKEIPPDWTEASRLLHLAAEMAQYMNYDSRSLCAAILSHPACSVEILYQAAVSWPLEDARLAANSPAAPDEVRVAAALRS